MLLFKQQSNNTRIFIAFVTIAELTNYDQYIKKMMLIMILCEGEHTYYHYQLIKCFK